MRQLNSFLAWGGGGLEQKLFKNSNALARRGVSKLSFDWYINFMLFQLNLMQVLDIYSESNKSNVPVKPGFNPVM